MQARDAAGRQVSLLNDDNSNFHHAQPPFFRRPLSFHPAGHPLPPPHQSPRSSCSSPNTPELLRSDSYDSQMSNDPVSPLTPSAEYAFVRPSLYSTDGPVSKRPACVDGNRSISHDEEGSAASSIPERSGKRYPCRYRDSHGCDKTFTTSGHASRHSKIHTAEKAVHCTYPGCHKKFTRADNMKQHLETHYKDKSRSSGTARGHKSAQVETRRNPPSSRSRSSTSTLARASMAASDAALWKMDKYPVAARHTRQAPLPPSLKGTGSCAWDMAGLNLPLLSRSVAARAPSCGLDALAMAVECQEGGGYS